MGAPAKNPGQGHSRDNNQVSSVEQPSPRHRVAGLCSQAAPCTDLHLFLQPRWHHRCMGNSVRAPNITALQPSPCADSCYSTAGGIPSGMQSLKPVLKQSHYGDNLTPTQGKQQRAKLCSHTDPFLLWQVECTLLKWRRISHCL